MPLARPTLTTLRDRIAGDIAARLPGSDPLLRRSLLDFIVHALAGTAHGLYGYIDAVAREALPDTASEETLRRWAAIFAVLPQAATFAKGTVTATGTNGSTVPKDSLLQRGDGVEYRVTSDATIASGTAALAVEAVVAGAEGNAAAASQLSFTSPVSGVDAAATVAAGGLTGGADAESDAALRARVLARIASPPQGGNLSDWRAWVREYPGVTREWITPAQAGSALVSVLFVLDDQIPITPTAPQIAAVEAILDVRKPVTSRHAVAAPTLVPLDIDVTLTPNTTAVQTAVLVELADMILRDAEPGGTILLSRIREAISIASGESNNVVTDPVADVVFSAGELPVLGTVTFS